jgi:microcystin degradation protein MlrC
MIDPEAAAILHRHKVGDSVTLALGGKMRPGLRRRAAALTGTVMHLSDGSYTGDGPILGGISHSFGPTAVFAGAGHRHSGRHPEPGQMLDPSRSAPLASSPSGLRFLVVKSMQHFRAAFEPRRRKGHRLRHRRAGHPAGASAPLQPRPARSGRWTVTRPSIPERPRRSG